MRVGVALLVALTVLAALAASCSRRERANPLDGANPSTGGAPEGFNAFADHGLVRLSWNARQDLPIDGFQLLRLEQGDSVYRSLTDVLPTFSSQFFDSNVLDGHDYRYRLFYVVHGELSAKPAEDVATPGPLRPWVVDAELGRVIRLTPDGRDALFSRTGFGNVGALAVTPGGGSIWVTDELAGTLDIVNPTALTGPHLTGLGAPAGIALDPVDGTAWVCDRGGAAVGAVLHFDASGARTPPVVLDNLDDPVSVATDPGDGSVWETEFGGGFVRHFQRDGTRIGGRPLLSPSRVAVDSTNSQAWVTSIASGWVWRVSTALTVLDSLRLQSPVGIALDWRRRTAWIADVDGNQLVAVNMDTRVVRFRVGNLGNPWDVAVDLATGDAWAVARGTSRAYRVSPTGVVLAAVGGLGDPFGIRLDPGVQ